jgi:hypothetical protein
MAQANNQQFYIQALLAIKQAGEKSPFGSDERKIYSAKANSLRETLKKMGYANVDADYGAGVSLANTPGGGKIDWNVLANAADILGTSRAGSANSAFDRALGEYLTRNIPVWQKQSASPSAAITSTASSVMGGGGAAESIIGGKSLTASPYNSGMQASQATATQTAKGAGTWNMGTAGGIEPTTPITPTSGTQVYGDFIKSEYFKNNDYEGYFLSVNKGLNIPTITDPTTGKVTIDWTNKDNPIPVSVFNSYGNMTKLWNTLQGLSKEKDTFNAIDIEKNPVFKEQLNVLDAEMQSLQKQFNLNVDAQLAGLRGSQAANKAGLEYELNIIKREIGASNWRSRQSLAASGMAFSGMLGYLYGQNEAKGMDATIRATAISAAEIKAIGEQMAILEGSKLSYSSDLERIYGGKKALARMTILDPQNGRLEEIGKLMDEAIAGFETEKGLVAPSVALEGRATEQATATAQAGAVTALNKDQLAALDKGYRITGMDENGIYSYSPILSGKELADFVTEGYKFNEDGTLAKGYEPPTDVVAGWLADGVLYDPETRTLSQVMSPKEVADFGVEGYSVDPKTGAVLGYEPTPEQIADWLSKGVRYDPKTKTFSKIVPATTGGGGNTVTDTNAPYNPDPDLKVLSNSGSSPTLVNDALLKLTAGKGALSDSNFAGFMQGGRYAIDANGNATLLAEGQKAPKGSREVVVDGLLGLDATKAETILHLIEDPVRQMAAAVILATKGKQGDTSAQWFDAMQSLMEANSDQYQFSTDEVATLQKILLGYFGNQPGPGGSNNVWQPPVYKNGKLVQEGYWSQP